MELATDQKVQLKSGVVAWRQRASFASQHMFSVDEADGAMARQRDAAIWPRLAAMQSEDSTSKTYYMLSTWTTGSKFSSPNFAIYVFEIFAYHPKKIKNMTCSSISAKKQHTSYSRWSLCSVFFCVHKQTHIQVCKGPC